MVRDQKESAVIQGLSGDVRRASSCGHIHADRAATVKLDGAPAAPKQLDTAGRPAYRAISGTRSGGGDPLPFQKPDAVDQHILSILEDNGRATNREIAESVGVSEGTVRNRIERLIRDDILRIVGVTNPARLGLNTAAVISVSAELARITDIAERIAAADGVVYVGYTTGNADIIALAFFPSNDELTDFMTQTLAAIPGILKAETNIILKPVRSMFPGATMNVVSRQPARLASVAKA
jgi:Lrp/AsnC family transcriptional regulator for asnA, asnC and gidA